MCVRELVLWLWRLVCLLFVSIRLGVYVRASVFAFGNSEFRASDPVTAINAQIGVPRKLCFITKINEEVTLKGTLQYISNAHCTILCIYQEMNGLKAKLSLCRFVIHFCFWIFFYSYTFFFTCSIKCL